MNVNSVRIIALLIAVCLLAIINVLADWLKVPTAAAGLVSLAAALVALIGVVIKDSGPPPGT